MNSYNNTEYKIIQDSSDEQDVKVKKPKKRMRKLAFWCIFVSLVFIIADVVLLFFFGKIWFVNPMKKEYKLMGISVSSKQGSISWDAVAMQNIDFAFIRATEGESLVDEYFSTSFDDALSAGIEAAPLHDFTFTSSGKDQAAAFIETVGEKRDRQLPPVVQLRLYGKFVAVPPDKEDVVSELSDFLEAVYEQSGLTPVNTADDEYSDAYLSDQYADYQISIRSAYSKPSDNDSFMFWLFNPKTKVNGCETDEYMDKITILKSEEEYYELFD